MERPRQQAKGTEQALHESDPQDVIRRRNPGRAMDGARVGRDGEQDRRDVVLAPDMYRLMTSPFLW